MPKRAPNNNEDSTATSHNETNPLAQARRGKLAGRRKKATPSGSQAEAHAKELWFRKTGTGLACFIAYYAQVTQSVESNDSDKDSANELLLSDFQLSTASNKSETKRAGQSRAALRRKRRKGGAVVEVANDDDGTAPLPSSDVTAPKRNRPVTRHPLWQALPAVQQPFLTAMVATLTRPLPLTLRIRATADRDDVERFALQLQACNQMIDESLWITKIETQESSSLELYQSPCPKAALPDDLKESLVQASQSGLIARQELGSTLPVAALQHAHAFATKGVGTVLDMCASPGSKTLQALEVLLNANKQFMLVANDVSQSRLDALQHAVARAGMPRTSGNITYTCQDATKFALRVAVKGNLATSSRTEPLRFDVILCDVPCSGDGTIRKDAHIVTRWTPDVSHQLHTTQLALLTRALHLLKPGGMVCYSTCSMNPVENEAVVAAAVSRYNQSSTRSPDSSSEQVELVECPDIPGVKLRNGLTSWKVAEHNVDQTNDEHDSDDELPDHKTAGGPNETAPNTTADSSNGSSRELLSWYTTFDDAVASGGHGGWKRTMWPPKDDTTCLSRCKRLWPQDQDSGGFFLALIQKAK